MLGVFVATLLVHLFSVALGSFTSRFLSTGWIELLSGLAFVGFGLWTIRGDQVDEENRAMKSLTSPFLIVTITFFLAELGDKTMLGTVTLSASHSLIPVWIGSTLGMVLADGLAIWIGQALGKKLPERAIKIGAAGIFFVFGFYYVLKGANVLWWVLPGLKGL